MNLYNSDTVSINTEIENNNLNNNNSKNKKVKKMENQELEVMEHLELKIKENEKLSTINEELIQLINVSKTNLNSENETIIRTTYSYKLMKNKLFNLNLDLKSILTDINIIHSQMDKSEPYLKDYCKKILFCNHYGTNPLFYSKVNKSERLRMKKFLFPNYYENN